MPKYRITVRDKDNVELSFVFTPRLKARTPVDRLREVRENLSKYGWYTRLKDTTLIRIEAI